MKTDTNRPLLKSGMSQQPILLVSISVSAAFLAVDVFRWTLVGWLTPYIEPMLELGLKAAFLCVLLWSLVHFGLRVRKIGVAHAGIPLLINPATLLIVVFVPVTQMTTALNFKWNYNKRMEVVSDVLEGKLGNSVANSGARDDFIHLPSSYRGLSAGGDDIMVYQRDGQTLMFFFDFRGILNSFSGFVYSTGGVRPKDGDFGGIFSDVEELRPNWYWVYSQ